jgi:hypothetical protein
MLKLADLRKTTRKAGEGELRVVYPRFLRDRTLAPRIELAVRYMEKMLGRPRRELDQEVIIGLFGDHKLARCIIASLATSYRHRARTFAEVLPAENVAALTARGLTTPSELRLWLFRRVNQVLPGFVGAPERAPFLAGSGLELGLASEQIERLIALDEPAQAVLVRTGVVPTPDDVIARYNYDVAAALLASASLVRIALARTPRDGAAIRALCAQAGVCGALAGRELVLYGRQDALASWARHGARLVRLLSYLLGCGLPARSGEALVEAPDGRQWRFRMDGDVLGFLGAPPPPTSAHVAFATGDLLAAWRRQDALMSEFAALRRAGGGEGWVLRRAAEPLIVAGAVVPTLFTCTRTGVRVPLVLEPASVEGSSRLAELAARVPLVALRICEPATDTSAQREATTVQPRRARRTQDTDEDLLTLACAERGDVAALPGLLAASAERAERRTSALRVEALLDEVRSAGVLTEVALAERLSCAEEDVAEHLAAQEVYTAWAEQGIHYVEGFGLCSGAILTRARAAAADVASLRERADGAARVARVLGRRLREVTGASAGIECLIAYLGAA